MERKNLSEILNYLGLPINYSGWIDEKKVFMNIARFICDYWKSDTPSILNQIKITALEAIEESSQFKNLNVVANNATLEMTFESFIYDPATEVQKYINLQNMVNLIEESQAELVRDSQLESVV